MVDVGLAVAVLSAVFNGSFAAFSKFKSAQLVHPLIFNLYLSFGVFASSCVAIPVAKLVPLSAPLICPLGFLAGLLFVGASSLSFVATKYVGLSTGQGLWGGSAILVAFLWGTLGPKPVGVPVASVPLSMLATSLLLLGVGGIVKCESLGSMLCRERKSREVTLADDATPPRVQPLLLPEGGPPLSEPPSSPLGGSRAIGVAAALSVGLFGGSILVPLGYLSAAYRGSNALASLPAFGAGSLVGSTTLCALWWGVSTQRAQRTSDQLRLSLGDRWTLAFGMASGLVWNLSNLLQIIAIKACPHGGDRTR